MLDPTSEGTYTFLEQLIAKIVLEVLDLLETGRKLSGDWSKQCIEKLREEENPKAATLLMPVSSIEALVKAAQK